MNDVEFLNDGEIEEAVRELDLDSIDEEDEVIEEPVYSTEEAEHIGIVAY